MTPASVVDPEDAVAEAAEVVRSEAEVAGVMEMAEEAAAKEAGAEGVAAVVQISLAIAQVLPEQTHFREPGSKTATIIVYIATM